MQISSDLNSDISHQQILDKMIWSYEFYQKNAVHYKLHCPKKLSQWSITINTLPPLARGGDIAQL